jgi:hypothetical protein
MIESRESAQLLKCRYDNPDLHLEGTEEWNS